MNKLAVLPEAHEFTQKTVGDLELLLLRQERSSSLISIDNEKQLLLSDRGLIRSNQFRFVTTALAETCRAACPGLWKVVNDLSCLYGDRSISPTEQAAAIAAFNYTVSARFSERLYGRTVVADSDKQRYDGILGPSYQHLCNSNLFDMLLNVSDGLGMQLERASVVGRRVRWIFCWPSPLAELSIEGILHQYQAGFAITNDETGEAAIRGRRIWFQPNDGWICPRQGGTERLIHTGQNFDRKLNAVLRRLAAEPGLKDFATIEACLSRLSKASLKLTSEDVDRRGERGKKVISFLVRCGLTNGLADKVLQTTCRQGIHKEIQRGPATLLAGSLYQRKAYDLFVCLLREIQKLSIFQRENAERAAFNMLQEYGYR